MLGNRKISSQCPLHVYLLSSQFHKVTFFSLPIVLQADLIPVFHALTLRCWDWKYASQNTAAIISDFILRKI